MATTNQTIEPYVWTEVQSGAAEMQFSATDSWMYVWGDAPPAVQFGHFVDAFRNEPIVVEAGENLYVKPFKQRSVVLVKTIDAGV